MFAVNRFGKDSGNGGFTHTASTGEQKAMEAIVAGHAGEVHRLVARVVGGGPDVEDLVQDVMVAVCTSSGPNSPGVSLRAWIYGIALNVCRNYLRKAQYQRSLSRSRQPISPNPAGQPQNEQT